MKKIILTLILGFFIQIGFAQKFTSVKIKDRITLQIPTDFVSIPDNELNTTFSSSQKPLAAYTNADGKLKFSIAMSNNQFTGSDLNVLKDMYKSTIGSLFDQIAFMQEKIISINKRKFIVFEFTSEIKPDKGSTYKNSLKSYSYIQYVLVKENLLVFNFTCPETYKEEWQPITKEIMNSIRIK